MNKLELTGLSLWIVALAWYFVSCVAFPQILDGTGDYIGKGIRSMIYGAGLSVAFGAARLDPDRHRHPSEDRPMSQPSTIADDECEVLEVRPHSAECDFVHIRVTSAVDATLYCEPRGHWLLHAPQGDCVRGRFGG